MTEAGQTARIQQLMGGVQLLATHRIKGDVGQKRGMCSMAACLVNDAERCVGNMEPWLGS